MRSAEGIKRRSLSNFPDVELDETNLLRGSDWNLLVKSKFQMPEGFASHGVAILDGRRVVAQRFTMEPLLIRWKYETSSNN